MQRLILSISGIATVAIILGCCGTGNFSSGTSKPSIGLAILDPDDLSDKAKKAPTISAKDLAAKYKEQATADDAFKEKWLTVAGDVEDAVVKDHFVTFRTDGSGFYVQCFFDEAWDAELAKLDSEKSAKICGRCTGINGGNVVLKDCFFPDAIPAIMEAKKQEADRKAMEAEAKKKQEAIEAEAKKKQEYGNHVLRKIEAWDKAKEIVTSCLKSPGTADFGGFFGPQGPEASVHFVGEPATYQVRGWVDSQNGFGAIVRTEFLLTLEYNVDTGWSLTEGPELVQR